MITCEMFGLNFDPFAPGSPIVVTEPVKAVLAQITGEFGRGVRAVVITGAPGTGKTLLLTLIQDSYKGRNLSISRVDLAALFPFALADTTDLLLVDEADSADPSALQAWLARHSERPRTMVLACRPEASARLCHELGAVAIHVRPLSASQAKDFIIERVTKAGRPDLFAPPALDHLIEASAGSPQALRSLAGMAMFLAVYSQASQIDASHVEEAVHSQGGFLPKDGRSGEATASAAVERVADEAQNVSLEPRDAAEQPAAPSCLADALLGLRRESRPRHRAFPARPLLAAATALLAAIPVSGSVFVGTEDHGAAHVAVASFTPRLIAPTPPRPANSLRRLERVANAVMPGRVVLAIVPQNSLQPVSIGSMGKQAPPLAQAQRQGVAVAPSGAASATSPLTAANIAGSQAVIAPERAGIVPARETSARLGLALPPKYMTANAISLALLDIAEQAGFRYDDEFVTFRACVFRRVSPGGAEQRAFWRAVESCLR
jgi:type II secretory pathway predicted ATPase ExeA